MRFYRNFMVGERVIQILTERGMNTRKRLLMNSISGLDQRMTWELGIRYAALSKSSLYQKLA